MPRPTPNYLWRKRATHEWLTGNELRLDVATGGTHSIVEKPGMRRLQVEMFCPSPAVAEKLKQTFGGAIAELPPDWHGQFLSARSMKPLRIGRRLVIASDPADAADEAVLVIPAGAAFGTGDHATTAMSLRMLERVSRPSRGKWRMLDAGTGSGILALAGKRFGATSVLAIDNDPTAIATARENARANRITRVRFVVGDVKASIAGSFDIITANLYSELLEEVLPQFRESLAGEGRMILSGVLRTQERQLVRALKANGFQVLEARRRGKWVALLCRA